MHLARDAWVSGQASGTLKTLIAFGGPGTGKTSILLQILDEAGWDASTAQIQLTDDLADYVARCNITQIYDVRVGTDETPAASILLVDDPSDWRTVVDAHRRALAADVSLLVYAIDLGQLQDTVSDTEWRSFLTRSHATPIHLTACYRQKSAVGQTALKYMETLSERNKAFFIDEKNAEFDAEHKTQNVKMNTLLFEQPGGHSQLYNPLNKSDWSYECNQIRKGGLWPHAVPLLIVKDGDLRLPRGASEDLRGIDHRIVDLEEVREVQGLEYQHVFIILKEERLREIREGRKGLSRSGFSRVRSLRIPFSRATDRLVVFVRPSNSSDEVVEFVRDDRQHNKPRLSRKAAIGMGLSEARLKGSQFRLR